ncbi:hypothetical protein FO519_010785, partial [Halicephalobus sp. NKZ332]
MPLWRAFRKNFKRNCRVWLIGLRITIWVVSIVDVDGIRAVQINRDKEYEEFVRGSNGPQKRRKYQRADERIRVIVEGGFGED